jgi:hypothetical protein
MLKATTNEENVPYIDKNILETHPYITLRKAISISFFELSTNLSNKKKQGFSLRNIFSFFKKKETYFEIKSIKQIKEDYKKSILLYNSFFPITDNRKETKFRRQELLKYFPEVVKIKSLRDLEKQIDLWISEVNIPYPETDRMFISFLKEEILNEKSFSFDEKDCIKIIGPAYLILTEIFNQTYDSLKKLYAIKYFESIKGSIQNFKDLR